MCAYIDVQCMMLCAKCWWLIVVPCVVDVVECVAVGAADVDATVSAAAVTVTAVTTTNMYA